MLSYTKKSFWKQFDSLPHEAKILAIKAFYLWSENPYNSGLNFKKLNSQNSLYSVRIGLNWRAIGKKYPDYILWYWIGSHEEYNKMF